MNESQYISVRVVGSTKDHHYSVQLHRVELTTDWLVIREDRNQTIVFAAPQRNVYLVERIFK